MPRVQITKEKILDTALRLLIRDGYEKVTIKAIANEIGCSTQPISWTFGNMENFRIALAEYALQYVNNKMHSAAGGAMEEYGRVGVVYIDMAFDEPHLVHFLHADEKRLQGSVGFGYSFDEKVKARRKKAFADQYGCTETQAERFMLDMLIYTQGLVSVILFGGLNIDKETAYRMLRETAEKIMSKGC